MKRIIYIVIVATLVSACASQPGGHCDAYGLNQTQDQEDTSAYHDKD